MLTGDQFDGILHGKVFEIGQRVIKQKVFGSDAGANFDERVVEVKVILNRDSGKRVAALSNAQLQVSITGTADVHVRSSQSAALSMPITLSKSKRALRVQRT